MPQNLAVVAELFIWKFLIFVLRFYVNVIIYITDDSGPGQGILATAKIGHGHCGREEFLFFRALRPNARAPAAMAAVAAGEIRAMTAHYVQLNFTFLSKTLQTLREGMGQAALVTNATALDTVITNALIIDSVAGIIKADVGIKVCTWSIGVGF